MTGAARLRPRGVIAAAMAMTVALGGVASAASAAVPQVAASSPATASPAAGCPATTLAGMSRAQRVGQLFMLGIGGSLEASERTLIREAHLGSVTFSALVTSGRSGVRSVTDAVQALATAATTDRVGFLVAANQEGGRVQALSGPGFSTIPSALEQGRLSTAVHRSRSATWAAQLRAAGVNVDLAPVGDIVPKAWESINQPIGRLDRAFGRGVHIVRTHVASFMAGMSQAGVLTSVKHFPGLGRVVGNTDFVAGVRDTVTTRTDPFLGPFRTAVRNSVPFVMLSLAEYTRIDPGTLAAFSSDIVTGLLRGTMGFSGVVMSDDLSAVAVRDIAPATRALQFIDAGGDLIIVTSLSDARRMAARLRTRAQRVPAFAARVDTSVLRILRAKDAAGLLPCS